MKKSLLFLTLAFALFTTSAQEFADFTLTGTHQGTGTFTNAALPNFTWIAAGTINNEVQILNNEVFDDGNEFENMFGQADQAENLRTQIYPNGSGTAGQPIFSKAKLTIDFDQITPAEGWGFCVVDIDVENCLISAVDENDNDVAIEDINDWLIELFDNNLTEDGLNTPKWDASHAALLGFNTPEDYMVYNNLILGGMDESEAAGAFFMPNIPLKSLIIDFENLQEGAYVSYHFYIASLRASGIHEDSDIHMNIYPNPADGEFRVQSLEFRLSRAALQLFGLDGKKLLEKTIPKGSEEITVDVRSLKSGVYFCRLTIGNKSVTKKLIIQK